MRVRFDGSELATLWLLGNSMQKRKLDDTPENFQWPSIDQLAYQHVVLPLVLSGASYLPEELQPEKELLLKWRNFTIMTAVHNVDSMRVQHETIQLLQTAGIRCAVLKGASVARHYPRAELRVLGDIDLLVSEEQCSKAVEILGANHYQRFEGDHPFHINFFCHGEVIELHHAVTDLPDSQNGNKIKDKLSGAIDRIQMAQFSDHSFPTLCEADQALSLLLHMERHMVDSSIGLRQLCDWSVFIDSLGMDVMRGEVLPAIKEVKMFQFASALTRICVDHLGLSGEKHRWCMYVQRKTSDSLLRDMFSGNNLRSGELERSTSKTFIMGEKSAEEQKSMLSSVTNNLSRSAKTQFPICKKLPILLPIFWVFIPVRYLFRAIAGTRPKQSVVKIAGYAMKRKKLYRNLKLFMK